MRSPQAVKNPSRNNNFASDKRFPLRVILYPTLRNPRQHHLPSPLPLSWILQRTRRVQSRKVEREDRVAKKVVPLRRTSALWYSPCSVCKFISHCPCEIFVRFLFDLDRIKINHSPCIHVCSSLLPFVGLESLGPYNMSTTLYGWQFSVWQARPLIQLLQE